ncbi:hypothetical protein BJF85_04770 [Saccharomonospora sp. CUA-673]|nr:hypothetical protein BJF85_04770 [Saccharomonospora sp. CUA-673]
MHAPQQPRGRCASSPVRRLGLLVAASPASRQAATASPCVRRCAAHRFTDDQQDLPAQQLGVLAQLGEIIGVIESGGLHAGCGRLAAWSRSCPICSERSRRWARTRICTGADRLCR